LHHSHQHIQQHPAQLSPDSTSPAISDRSSVDPTGPVDSLPSNHGGSGTNTTKRAQHEKGMHDQQNSNPLPSPRRVAVPVLVRDGKPCLSGGPKHADGGGLQVPGAPMMMGSHGHLMYGQPRVWW
ncbi:homeobox protein Nkx-2.2, partial [Asbolus verrucosus]